MPVYYKQAQIDYYVKLINWKSPEFTMGRCHVSVVSKWGLMPLGDWFSYDILLRLR